MESGCSAILGEVAGGGEEWRGETDRVSIVESRGVKIWKSDRGDPDTDKGREPQADTAVNIRCIYLPTF